MRVSVSQHKGEGSTRCKVRPDPLSKRGKMFDILMENKGRVVFIHEIFEKSGLSQARFYVEIERLNQDYELDIRNISYGFWCLCGRYEGTKYIDYVAEAHAKPPR